MDVRLIICILLGVSTIFLLAMYKRCRHPFGTFLATAALGIGAHLLVYYTSVFTGVHLPLNPYTLASSTILSLPGVIMMVVLGIL